MRQHKTRLATLNNKSGLMPVFTQHLLGGTGGTTGGSQTGEGSNHTEHEPPPTGN